MAELTDEQAKTCANRLKFIRGFPGTFDPELLVIAALDLIRWCKGASINDHEVSPEDQALWLVDTAREKWDNWPGTAAVKQLFDERFPPSPSNPAGGFIDYSNMPCICSSSKKFKDCCQGKSFDDEVDRLRKKLPRGGVQ